MEDSLASKSMTLEETLYLFRHIFLPPEVPQAEDYNVQQEHRLLESVVDALRSFSDYVPTADTTIVHKATEMVSRLRKAYSPHGDVDEKQLEMSLAELPIRGGVLPIHVREQNAGILLYWHNDAIHIESFELSARNEAVTTTVGRLRRAFPGPTMVMNRATLEEPGFRAFMAQTISRMSHQPVVGTKPRVKKAGQEHDETRDTTHPKMVTELFMSTLRPRCTDIASVQIQKNTREEVMWRDSQSPWRRSALWLLVRVTLQLVFRRLSTEGSLDDLYKQFMVFFMASIVDRASIAIPSESLFLMNAKIVRRLLKLDSAVVPAWFTSVQEILSRTSGAIQGQWTHIMSKNSHSVDMPLLRDLNFRQDIQCALPCLDRYLESIENRSNKRPCRQNFQPQSKLIKFQRTELPNQFDSHDSDYQAHNLAAFEDWVASDLNAWLEIHQGEEAACGQLGALMTRYFEKASAWYSDNPEATSVMLLTLLDLWIACDKSAIHLHGTLRDYDACIPVDCFQSLLLPFRSHMERLACAEKYLSRRQARLRYHGPSIFQEFGTSSCFAVRYFEQSHKHQQLLAAIEKNATQERTKKKTELWEKQQRYRELMALSSKTPCEFVEIIVDKRHGLRDRVHHSDCPRERYQRQAESIEISIHEWPLPTNRSRAKATVFELRVPEPFGSWRDTTLFFLHQCLNMKYAVEERPRAEHRPHTYRGLSSFFSNHGRNQRISLLSQDKPHERTHRRERLILNVTENDVCLNNGLHFQYFDNVLGCFVSGFDWTHQTEISCTYRLPVHSSALQQFLFRPATNPHGPSPNTVIATQCDAPADMSLEEYKALATMPLGLEIQWQNILLELSMPSVDMKKIETTIFVLQIINQAGPSKAGTTLRQGHAILCDDVFTVEVLSRIEETMERIQQNWETIYGLNSLIRLVVKISSLSPSRKVCAMCLQCLNNLRRSAFHWVNLVRTKASETIDDTHKTYLIAKSVHIALVCIETFNAETIAPVFAVSADVSIFLQCCSVIRNGRNSLTIESGSLLQMLYHRWQVLSYRSHVILAERIVECKNPGLDLAIDAAWAAYDKTSKWPRVPNDVTYWLFTRFAGQSGSSEDMLLHYNLLTGELLVDGLPLARLPSEYESHPTYRNLFGKSQLDVMPSNTPGMQFSCQKQYSGYTVHLGKETVPESTDSDMPVKAVKGGEQVWQLVPSRLFAGAFPDEFVEGYAHWYSVSGNLVEFRPLEAPWLSSSQNWHLQRSSCQASWSLKKNGTILVSTMCQTAQVISNAFQPIEKALKVHCIFHEASSSLHVELPRLRLEFILKSQSSAIQSRQYPGMSVDSNQVFDSLIGLRNTLLLTNRDSYDQLVLIPEGALSWARDGNHVRVEIGWQPATTIHAYPIDRQLGRLLDNGSLQSKLYLTYLHALTSFCLPDPLTKKTGTEQALSILRSASLRSFDCLQTEHIELLKSIASLTPARRFYPENERVMQSIHWRQGLGCLSQHHGFREEVANILDQNRRMSIFQPGTELNYPLLPHVEQALFLRERIRTSSFRAPGFGADDHTQEYDSMYNSLDKNRISCAASRSFTVCKMLYKGIPSVRKLQSEQLSSHIWQFLSLPTGVRGPHTPLDTKRLRYDAEWILESREFLVSNWCSIHHLACSQTRRLGKFQLMIWLAALAFSDEANMIALETIVSLFVIRDLASIHLPTSALFLPKEGAEMIKTSIRRQIESEQRKVTPESKLAPETNETFQQLMSRRDRLRNQKREALKKSLLLHFEREWPTRSPSSLLNPTVNDYFDAQEMMTKVSRLFSIWFDNRDLKRYITDIANVTCYQLIEEVEIQPYQLPHPPQSAPKKRGFVLFDDLLGPQPIIDIEEPQLRNLVSTSPTGQPPAPTLVVLLNSLGIQAKSKYEKNYVEQLQSSVASLKDGRKEKHINMAQGDLETNILDYLASCQEYVDRVYRSLLSELCPREHQTTWSGTMHPFRAKVIAVALELQQYPRLSPVLLLEQLSLHRWGPLDLDWKKCFIAYGCSITKLQRAKRLARLLKHPDELLKELENLGHTNWQPIQFPETLLLEIENGILIRGIQEEIAATMRHFVPGKNAVMQLNMGEGKSSVIVPMVVADLANGVCLVRVLVAKPQSRQMFQMLVAKLGGLLGRRVYHMPIARSLKFGEAEAEEIERMCLECMSQGGVLLIQPEHILSLKLMSLECFIAGKCAVGRSLLRTLQFFQHNSRDIVDESDENFSVKFELIYTMGSQRPVELSPRRWIVVQELLQLVRDYAGRVQSEFPDSIEVSEQPHGGFPRIRLLKQDAEKALVQYVGRHICENGIGSLSISRQARPIRDAVYTYIMKSEPLVEEIAAVECEDSAGFWGESTRASLLLIRGLLAGGVLAFCLGQKRWRVNYGPDRSRNPPTRLCVPYRAKDSPSLRSEFSHPDVVILLTCLNYYYAGLGDDDIFVAFNHLVGSDQASAEYQEWTNDASWLPPTYQQLVGVNLDDRSHCTDHVFPALRFSKATVDYFLTHVVFPKEMKEFPDRLSASGWDIGEIKTHPTVGFSGTNDSRETLPLSVSQLDLPEQNHTNALVLEYLLRPENSVACIPRQVQLCKSDAEIILDLVLDLNPPAQVILDVGAQILELSNHDLAAHWLKLLPKEGPVQAVVFVNDKDDICVLDRTGRVELLQISPFARQMEACFVFLDEAHTRGIDLKLPSNYRAAVTLGPGITKDKLVQACMRMRKLGNGQSVVFCVPEEVKSNILALSGKDKNSQITVSDVLLWAISETWIDSRHSIPLWAVQGTRFERQRELWQAYRQNDCLDLTLGQAQEFLEPECQTLEQRYRPGHQAQPSFNCPSDTSLNLNLIWKRCRKFEGLDTSSSLQEEQERELAPEVESERQVQRPPSATPETHHIHPHISSFVTTGILVRSSEAYEPAYLTLRNTSAARFLDVSQFPSSLLASNDFVRAIKTPPGSHFVADAFQRPVRWVLTSRNHVVDDETPQLRMMIISPYEANGLMSRIRESQVVTLHLYAPRQSRAFPSLDRLGLYTVPDDGVKTEIPDIFRMLLNLFSGQLYLESYSEYKDLCEFLGVASVKTPPGLVVAADGFIKRGFPGAKTGFSHSPLKFLEILMSQIRKDCQRIGRTHIGKIVSGQLLFPLDFEGSATASIEAGLQMASLGP
ncbi:hypothetical protein N7489_003275 [Penicillium chrysogenum]|uniref:uncharacterized protein n=1 Tax=Penicillium chrysogenum TaxID=5076 RepID=UPI0024DF262F|nr:uncharacterized protein N7489_003275 [Penicillium chrysogenum]KAJ5252865.1 hypothetical protein N7489_003275 [Penicillium chrysogenum]